VPVLLARKIATAKKEAAKARAGKNFFPQPPSFLPARASSFGSAARSAPRQFCSKNVRAKLYKDTKKQNFCILYHKIPIGRL